MVKSIACEHGQLARSCEICDLESQLAREKERSGKLVEALQWYADAKHLYFTDPAYKARPYHMLPVFVHPWCCSEIETGQRARQVLEEQGE